MGCGFNGAQMYEASLRNHALAYVDLDEAFVFLLFLISRFGKWVGFSFGFYGMGTFWAVENSNLFFW